jgi:predicted nucleic acid-binding protein
MIAVDTNILVAFHRTEYSHHDAAVEALTSLAEGSEPWAIPWPCLHEFTAVVTNGRIFSQPTEPAIAVSVVDALIESPVLRLLGEGAGYWSALRSLILKGKITGARVHDARIADAQMPESTDHMSRQSSNPISHRIPSATGKFNP